MHLSSGVLLLSFLLPLEGFAGKVHGRASGRAHHGMRQLNPLNPPKPIPSSGAGQPSNSTKYTLKDMYRGESFSTEWDFFTGPDPTHGNVNYQSKANAENKNLFRVQADGTTLLAVDDTSFIPVGGKRDSVRISSKTKYNSGLFIADFLAMPHGCSVWPAWWSVGPDWPNGGEIDIFEGVHDMPFNQYTLHSSEGCSLSTDDQEVTGELMGTTCASSGGSNAGCGFRDRDTRTYGRAFNDVAGGVYAHLWNSKGIKMWHFARTEIPADITARVPNPDSWGSPVAFWSSKTCDMNKYFYEHALVLDTTICGDWAGPTYADAKCPGTCAERVANPKNYIAAKWKINYIAVYE